ncbi:MAG: hypothetical protein ACI3W6_00615, partial [Clostridia bacterium]
EKGLRRRGDAALLNGFEKSFDFLLCHFFCSKILNLIYIINQKTALCKETFLCYSRSRQKNRKKAKERSENGRRTM